MVNTADSAGAVECASSSLNFSQSTEKFSLFYQGLAIVVSHFYNVGHNFHCCNSDIDR